MQCCTQSVFNCFVHSSLFQRLVMTRCARTGHPESMIRRIFRPTHRRPGWIPRFCPPSPNGIVSSVSVRAAARFGTAAVDVGRAAAHRLGSIVVGLVVVGAAAVHLVNVGDEARRRRRTPIARRRRRSSKSSSTDSSSSSSNNSTSKQKRRRPTTEAEQTQRSQQAKKASAAASTASGKPRPKSAPKKKAKAKPKPAQPKAKGKQKATVRAGKARATPKSKQKPDDSGSSKQQQQQRDRHVPGPLQHNPPRTRSTRVAKLRKGGGGGEGGGCLLSLPITTALLLQEEQERNCGECGECQGQGTVGRSVVVSTASVFFVFFFLFGIVPWSVRALLTNAAFSRGTDD